MILVLFCLYLWCSAPYKIPLKHKRTAQLMFKNHRFYTFCPFRAFCFPFLLLQCSTNYAKKKLIFSLRLKIWNVYTRIQKKKIKKYNEYHATRVYRQTKIFICSLGYIIPFSLVFAGGPCFATQLLSAHSTLFLISKSGKPSTVLPFSLAVVYTRKKKTSQFLVSEKSLGFLHTKHTSKQMRQRLCAVSFLFTLRECISNSKFSLKNSVFLNVVLTDSYNCPFERLKCIK